MKMLIFAKMKGRLTWDPLRKKNVPLTPEENVRQWFITMLRDKMEVPMHMMMSEVGLKYGTGPVQKEFRADIVVFDRTLSPIMVVECKRPDIELTEQTVEQALRYDMVLDVKYITITNGRSTFICVKEDGKLRFLSVTPKYGEMAGAEKDK